MVAFDGGFLDGSVHTLNLSVGPGMLWFRQPVFNAVFMTTDVEHMRPVLCRGSVAVTWQMAELSAIIRQDRMDFIRDGLNQIAQEGG